MLRRKHQTNTSRGIVHNKVDLRAEKTMRSGHQVLLPSRGETDSGRSTAPAVTGTLCSPNVACGFGNAGVAISRVLLIVLWRTLLSGNRWEASPHMDSRFLDTDLVQNEV